MERSLRFSGRHAKPSAITRESRATTRGSHRPMRRPSGARLELATILLAVAAVATAWSGLPGDALEREAGEGDSAAARDKDRSARRRGSHRRRPRSTWRRSSSGSTPTRKKDTTLQDFTSALPRRVQAGRCGLARDEAAQVPDAPLTPFTMPQYKLDRDRGGRAPGCRRRGVSAAQVPAKHPALVELLARGRALLGRALLRGYQQRLKVPRRPDRSSESAAPSSSDTGRIATSPVSLTARDAAG